MQNIQALLRSALVLWFGISFPAKNASAKQAKSINKKEVVIPRACKPPHDGYDFCNSSLPLDQRLDDLINRLTLDEKPYLLVARESPLGNISRLGIPEYDFSGNCMHGVQSRCSPEGKCATSFPNPNALGATYNRSLWRAMGNVIGLELRALWLQNVGENDQQNLPHIGLDCWSPNVGIQRDPRWGRNMETPSEDPYLCGQYGKEHVLGLQNNSALDERYFQAVATLKHFDANSLEGNWLPDGTYDKENGKITRHTVDAKISLYDLYSSYLPAFKASVVEGGAAGIMCSYNSINGVPSCANEWLLKEVLRNEWKFRGYVTGDSGAVCDVLSEHKYTRSWNETVSATLRAGCDVESAPWGREGRFRTGGPYIEYIPTAVRQGFVDEAFVDEALRHALGIRFRLGLFDPIDDQPFWNVSPGVVQSKQHVGLARDATAQGFVLLQNKGNLLPLDISAKPRLAIIGPHANDRAVMSGNYNGQICPDGFGRSCVTSFSEGFQNLGRSHGFDLVVVPGCSVHGNSTKDFGAAAAAAGASDAVVFIGGIDLTIEQEGHDRADIGLPDVQVALLKQLQSVNQKIIVVLLHGGMVGVDEIVDSVPAIVSAGYPGRYAGELLAPALFGLTTKAWGKLPVTWYKSSIVEELNMLDFDMGKAPGRTYRYFTGRPLFPFGHGLNPLTEFDIMHQAPSIAMQQGTIVRNKNYTASGARATTTTAFLELSVAIRNIGVRSGDEVVLAFFSPGPGAIGDRSEPASKLQRQLFGFERVSLEPGQSQTVSFRVSAAALQLFDGAGNPTIFPGTYIIEITNGNDRSVVHKVRLESDQSIGYESSSLYDDKGQFNEE